MASEELVRTLDYILNRCNERDIDAIAAAVIRRRKDIAMFGSMPAIPNARAMAEELNSQLNIQGSIDGLKDSVRDYVVRIIKQQAPELSDRQVEELTRSWVPGPGQAQAAGRGSPQEQSLPKNVLASMIDQFVSFSLGRMEEEEDKALRREIGPWPDKYWKAFPQVVRLLITDFIKGEINESDFNTRMGLALQMR